MQHASNVLIGIITWWSLVGAHAFLITPVTQRVEHTLPRLDASSTTSSTDTPATLSSSPSPSSSSSSSNDARLEIVVFGVGDLRVDDHLGLQAALVSVRDATDSGSDTGAVLVVPLFILTDTMISNLPGAVAHTVDTAQLLSAALDDLDSNLRASIHPRLALHTMLSKDKSISAILREVIDAHQALPSNVGSVRVHMCDLGDVDNQMKYNPWGQMLSESEAEKKDRTFEVVTWSNMLRAEPWQCVDTMSVSFPTYESKQVTGTPPMTPVTIHALETNDNATVWVQPLLAETCHSFVPTPSSDILVERFVQVVKRDPALCHFETNTGLFGTHWGGLVAASIGCQSVMPILQAYVTECNEDSVAWSKHPLYTLRTCTRNSKSLEHASMAWQLAGDGTSPTGNVQTNWLAGEAMLRYLAAPLLFGTVSPRRIWHLASLPRSSKLLLFHSPLQRLVEGQEWHRLLAARYLRTEASLQQRNGQSTGTTTYKYWRYHGFLCRYACTEFVTPLTARCDDDATQKSQVGVLLVHGFGASGSQWNKAMVELSGMDTSASEGLAPDLIGFGQSEKPAISYTGYMWDSQMMDFSKEIAVHKHQWTTFVTGGNSIGGFTSLSLAACDSATDQTVSSTGAPGTGQCVGLVLMNSAGPVKTKNEVETEEKEAALNGKPLLSVAQATAMQALPVCRPPPRPVARIFGNVLLGYLRPRIQSICRNLYPTNAAAVDTLLCSDIERDSLDPGAINVMMAGAKLPPPRTANELLAADFGAAVSTLPEQQVSESCFTGPVLIAQGVLDPLNNSTDRMYRYQSLREGIDISPIPAGHCPHDELPDQIAKSIAAWMSTSAIRTSVQTRLASSIPR